MDLSDLVKRIKDKLSPDISIAEIREIVRGLRSLGYTKREIMKYMTKFHRPKKPKGRKVASQAHLNVDRASGKPKEPNDKMREIRDFNFENIQRVASIITEDPDLFRCGPRWTKPEWDEERDELERTAEEYDLSNIKSLFSQGRLVDLSDQVWSNLENTDSWRISSSEMRRLSREYNRDLESILSGFRGRDVFPAPIVLDVEPPYLVAGNTRLMASSVFDVRPKIWLIPSEER